MAVDFNEFVKKAGLEKDLCGRGQEILDASGANDLEEIGDLAEKLELPGSKDVNTDVVASPKCCFFAPMGTKGDLLPMLYAAIVAVKATNRNILFLSQPCFASMIKKRMSQCHGFRVLDAIPDVKVTRSCDRYTCEDCAAFPYMKVGKKSEGTRQVSMMFEKVIYENSEGGQLTLLWATPSNGSRFSFSCNQEDFQTAFSVHERSRKVHFGDFLGNWQACLAHAQASECPDAAIFVSTGWSLPAQLRMFEEAVGIDSSMIMRFGSLGLLDNPNEGRHYHANSPTLSPEMIQLQSSVAFTAAIEKHGVMSEPMNMFTPDPLPERITDFLEKRNTVVVTISSFGQGSKLAKMFPASDEFQVLFLGCDRPCDDADPNHLYHNELVHLDTVFQKAALIVHGCGVGTINQVALSGKPSIGVSGFLEQESNGLALEKLQVSNHCTLKSLETDESAIRDFAASIVSFFDGKASCWLCVSL